VPQVGSTRVSEDAETVPRVHSDIHADGSLTLGFPLLPGWYAALAREWEQETAGQDGGAAVRML